MLERTTGCLDASNLRRLVPKSKKLLRSQRLLHSLFWRHGAADVELSVLFKAPDSTDGKDIPDSLLGSGPFLDFLYPFGALQFGRQYITDRQDGRRPRRSMCPPQRLFTSVAGDAPQTNTTVSSTKPEILTPIAGDSLHTTSTVPAVEPEAPTKILERLLRSAAAEYDEIWLRYENIDPPDRRKLASKVMKYLSTSMNQSHARHIPETFRLLKNPQVSDYDTLIQAYLTLRQFQNALSAYQECLTVWKKPAATDFLFQELVVSSEYDAALELWTSNTRHQESNDSGSDIIMRLLRGHPSFQSQILQLSKTIQFPSEQIVYTIAEPTWNDFECFMSTLIYEAMFPPSLDFNLAMFQDLLAQLRRWNLDLSGAYEKTIEMLSDVGQKNLAVQLFQEYRGETVIKISQTCLYCVLDLAIDIQDLNLAEEVYKEWLRFHKKPSSRVYGRLLKTYAVAGDFDSVQMLFDDYTRMHRGRFMVDAFIPVLQAHADCGHLEEVDRWKKKMEQLYGSLPDIRIWNALLHAYGRVGNTDGAFDKFEELLASPTAPDHRTFSIMMAICIDRGDLEQAMDLIKFAESLGLSPDIRMLTQLVLGYCNERRFEEAEKLCRDSLKLRDESSPVTPMWNHLLKGYGKQRDVPNVNRILQIMRDAHVEFDGYTYSAMMETLCMVGQPNLANEILWDVMPEAGIVVTDFHCAIVLGGYLRTKQLDHLFRLYTRIQNHPLIQTKDKVKLVMLKAAETVTDLRDDNLERLLKKADKFIQEAYLSDGLTQGGDADFLASRTEYLMYVYGKRQAYDKVKELYTSYREKVPEGNSVQLLSRMMTAEYTRGDHDEVMRYWELAFEQAKQAGSPVRPSPKTTIVPTHQYDLTNHLSTLMLSLSNQGKWSLLDSIIRDTTNIGFRLDMRNYNLYVQLLAKAHKYQQAFEICEIHLMRNWIGWARVRWSSPVRNRLPIELRNLKKDKTYQRPIAHTLIYLAKAFIDLSALAVEVKGARGVLEQIKTQCPMTVHAIKTMKRTGDELERSVFAPVE